ncbi:unnamed protein product [Miscanthus lutarioriparius]|uniref:2-carboxy-D-arabinitol-1-phosphatase n=1 Tax=Miscanthus lutarioriparius TaxID=422564 RepID=A0A811QC38_9POAL|nr:unnamed protein product [Miscanthus lutarioriparius]
MLLSDSFDACFTSPLARSRRTAEIIWQGRDDDLIPDSDLREIDLYSFQGLLKHEGKERYGVLYRQWQKNAANFSIDGHYPVQELWGRAQSCWERILAHQGKSVLVVAHNAVNQALVATSLGLGAEYFRILLQSNCGASVLDFTPQTSGGPPSVCLNRLNQTPNSPVAGGSSAERKTSKRIILACQGATQSSSEISLGGMGYAPLNMLGTIQSQKTAELLLDLKVNSIICSPQVAAVDTATVICEVQEAADCLGADCVPRYVEMKKLIELEIEDAFQAKQKSFGEIVQSGWVGGMEYKLLERLWAQSKDAWKALLNELTDDTSERVLVAVGHPAIHLALICRCLDLPMEYMSSFHLDDGSICVIDFPDGPKGRGIIRCTNYTAHLGRCPSSSSSTALYRLLQHLEPSPNMLRSIWCYSCKPLMEYSTPHQVSRYQQHGYSGDGHYTGRPRSTAGGESDDALLFLAVPAGWLIRLLAFLGELVASAILSLVFPVAALVGVLRALPAAVASSLRRAARGLLAAACTFAALVAALLVSVLLGFLLVRHWVEDPVTVRQQLFFDYTEAQPSAAVVLDGARGAGAGAVLPAGHSVRVSMALLFPDSYHNREVGMFQIKAEAVSVSGITMASATQPYMLRYKSTPVRLAQSALLCVPLTLGIRSETQAASLKVLQYREGHGRHRRTGVIRVLLQPRAATVQLPQVYRAEVVVQTALPWAKSLARGMKWTLCVWVSSSVHIALIVLAVCWARPLVVSARNRRLSEIQADGKMASGLGSEDIGESSSKEVSEDFAVK